MVGLLCHVLEEFFFFLVGELSLFFFFFFKLLYVNYILAADWGWWKSAW